MGLDSSLEDDGSAEDLQELIVVLDGQLNVSRDDPFLVALLSLSSRKIEKFGADVFHDCSQHDSCRFSDSRIQSVLSHEFLNSRNREQQSSLELGGSLFLLLPDSLGSDLLLAH